MKTVEYKLTTNIENKNLIKIHNKINYADGTFDSVSHLYSMEHLISNMKRLIKFATYIKIDEE